ncbi:MAG TPA: methyltransferase domain-containing protein, partial [bacterium]|nr:methyltransferase domain-containing protein [bacterium]
IPLLIAVIVVSALLIKGLSQLNLISYSLARSYHEGSIYFGGEPIAGPNKYQNLTISMVIGVVFTITTAIFIGLGQLTGRLFDRFESPVKAYCINVGAGILGVFSFSAISFFGIPSWVWFVLVALLVLWIMMRIGEKNKLIHALLLLLSIAAVFAVNRTMDGKITYWSPYYKIVYEKPTIIVNDIGHQAMVDNGKGRFPLTYNLPFLLFRDAENKTFNDVLIIGAGSGNDVSHALKYGASKVDAVEIDPIIMKIGKRDHPNKPYSDPRVKFINDDGRSYLRKTDKKYDLVIYALVDSLTLMSSFSSVRLENFLFTQNAFEDVKSRLKPGGVFVIYNFFRENWLTYRIYQMLEKSFGSKPLLVMLPPEKVLLKEGRSTAAFSIFIVGDTEKLSRIFKERGEYSVLKNEKDFNYNFNGFAPIAAKPLKSIYSTKINESKSNENPDDNWPFIYMKEKKIPSQNILGLVFLAIFSMISMTAFVGKKGISKISIHFFALGGAFMLLETESVVKLALIHGSTWFVNSVVFISVLTMTFIANIFVIKRPVKKIMITYFL